MYRKMGDTPPDSSLDEIFTTVYRNQLWGAPKPWQSRRARFFSGPGSHARAVVKPYISAVRRFLKANPGLDAVDLGCGDFNVGRQLRPLCNRYVACDIVPDLIEYNRGSFSKMDVDFRCVNIVSEALPEGDVVFLRQVLQHLDNKQIGSLVSKLAHSYTFLILTEHLPSKSQFVPNLDHTSGSGLRLSHDSGVVLTAAPFNLAVKSQHRLCAIEQFGGLIVTDLYELAK
jgi:SAM-dependent methyltransferase